MPRAKVALRCADGTILDTWHTITVRQAFTDPLDDFSFTSRPVCSDWQRYARLLRKGERVTVLINDVPQGDYLIVTSEDEDDADNAVTFHVSLKTPLCTPYEGGIDPDISLKSPSDVEVTTAILKALGPYGFDRIEAGTRASVSAITGKPINGRPQRYTPVRDLKHRDAVGHENESAYAFCARIITRLGQVLRVRADGVLSIEEPDYEQDPSYTVVRTTRGGYGTDADFFIGAVKVHESNEGQFSECTVRGQRPLDPNTAATARPHAVAAASVLPARSAYRSSVAPYKPKFFKDKSSSGTDRTANVAHFELGMRAAQAFYIEGEVDGWVSSSGAIWQVNTTARVVHERRGIDEVMWLSELTRHQDSEGGQRTTVRFIPLGALILGDPKRG